MQWKMKKKSALHCFFTNFSTSFRTQPAYIWWICSYCPDHRGRGYGKSLMKKLAQIAVERKLAAGWSGGVWTG
jgi:L-amino acid N-acyltransferase YncA